VSAVSVMTANNETGVLQPVAAVAELLADRAPRAVLHTDAVAAAPWLDLASWVARADLITISGHKVGGPKGIGARVVRNGAQVAPRWHGGGEERERRRGTPSVAGAVGFAGAVAASAADRGAAVARTEAARARLVAGLVAAAPDAVVMSPVDPHD